MKFTKGKRITLPALPEMGIKKPQRAIVISPPKNGVMMCEVDMRDRQRGDPPDGLVEVQVENGKIVFDPAMPPCDESDLVEIPERLTPHQRDDRYLDSDELVMRVPAAMIPGEWGDRFPRPLIKMLRAMAAQSYEPMDFGLTDGKSYIEIHFQKCLKQTAIRHTEAFIERGGSADGDC